MGGDGSDLTIEQWIYEWCAEHRAGQQNSEGIGKRIGVDPRFITGTEAHKLAAKLHAANGTLIPVHTMLVLLWYYFCKKIKHPTPFTI